MALSPFRGFYDMQSEMNRMFDEAFGGLTRRGGGRR
jgi:HSP20 family protein